MICVEDGKTMINEEKYTNLTIDELSELWKKTYSELIDNMFKWEWNGQEVNGVYVHYITMDMGNDPPYMFAGLQAGNNARLWTRDKSKVIVFESDFTARKFIDKHFTKQEQQKLLIVREP